MPTTTLTGCVYTVDKLIAVGNALPLPLVLPTADVRHSVRSTQSKQHHYQK